jgi:hypothetical protein
MLALMTPDPTLRLCTDEQLGEFCRPGRERIHRAIADGDPDAFRPIYERVATARLNMVNTFTGWAAQTFEWLAQEGGSDAIETALDPERWIVLAARGGIDGATAELAAELFAGTSETVDRLVEQVAAGDAEAARALWEEIEAAVLLAHDTRRDWLTSIWSEIHRAHGNEGIESMMRHLGDAPRWQQFLLDLERQDTVGKLEDFAYILTVGNFGEASITEHDDQFVLHYTVCGSCGSQELGGRYEPPWCFRRIEGRVPRFNSGDTHTTVYRAHQAMLHSVMAIERIGVPVPVIECAGPDRPTPCAFRFYKDPAATPAHYFERVGFSSPPAVG